MRRRTILGLFGVVVLVAVLAISVLAGPMQDVQISVVTDLNTPPSSTDPFLATGPAVNELILCATGLVSTGPYPWPPPPSGSVTMVKYFVCADGTFDVELRVRLLDGGNTVGKWKIIGGTGSYVGLKGNGTLTGTYDVTTNTVLDVYTGRIRLSGPPGTKPPWWAGKS
jgi:hypothetical protein